MEVKIYKTNGCPWCEKAIKYIESKGHPVHVFNCSENENFRKALIEKTKQSSVPVIEIGEITIIGFDKKMIDAAL